MILVQSKGTYYYAEPKSTDSINIGDVVLVETRYAGKIGDHDLFYVDNVGQFAFEGTVYTKVEEEK